MFEIGKSMFFEVRQWLGSMFGGAILSWCPQQKSCEGKHSATIYFLYIYA